MKIEHIRFKMPAKVRRLGKMNGWSTCVGEAVMPNDVVVRYAWCGPTCRRRPDCWFFLPVRERRHRDRGERCYQLCSEWDVPAALRVLVRAGNGAMKNYRRCKKDPRVGPELQTLALGCIGLEEPQPLWDWLLEHHGIEHGVNGWNIDAAVAGAIARWEWPFA